MSYAELGDAVRGIARGLMALGIEPGDRVSILSGTRAEWTLADLGALCAGAVVAPIYHTNSPGECRYVLEHAGSRVVFCEDAEQVAKVARWRDGMPRPGACRRVGRHGRGALTLDDLQARGADVEPEELEAVAAAVAAGDTATIVYTSGTTGPPKGCVTTHDNVMATARMYEDELEFASERRPGRGVHVPAARPLAGARDADGHARRGRHDRVLARRSEGRPGGPRGAPARRTCRPSRASSRRCTRRRWRR